MDGPDPDTSETTPETEHRDESAANELAITLRDFSEWRGKDLIDGAGERIGKLEDVYFDVETDQPQFGTVKEGLFGRHLTFLPLTEVTVGPNDLQIPILKNKVKDAPHIGSEGDALTQEEESNLYHYYQLNYTPSGTPTGRRLARR